MSHPQKKVSKEWIKSARSDLQELRLLISRLFSMLALPSSAITILPPSQQQQQPSTLIPSTTPSPPLAAPVSTITAPTTATSSTMGQNATDGSTTTTSVVTGGSNNQTTSLPTTGQKDDIPSTTTTITTGNSAVPQSTTATATTTTTTTTGIPSFQSPSLPSPSQRITLPMGNTPSDIHTIMTLIVKCNTRIKQYLPEIEIYLSKRIENEKILNSILNSQNKISKKLYILQLLDENIVSELQTYPYTRPENVRDDFAPIMTSEAFDANKISTSHLYPPLQQDSYHHDGKQQENESNNSMSSSSSMSYSISSPSSIPSSKTRHYVVSNYQTPTVPIETILFMSRQLQFYLSAPNNPPDFKRFGKSYPPQIFLQGLLTKQVDVLLQEMSAFMS